MAKSYDMSKNFSGNMKAPIKDQFCFSPAKTENYDYKEGVVKEIHLMGVQNQHEPAYGQYSNKMSSRMAKYEQDKEML